MNFANTAIVAALRAGQKILNIYNDPFSVSYKEDQSPRTLADTMASECIEQQLKETDLPFLSEEGKEIPYDVRSQWQRFWLVDPLDGTKEFIKRNDEFTVNIALIENGKPLLGVVYVPVTDVLYCGDTQVGAYRLLEASRLLKENSIDFELMQKLPLPGENQVVTVVASRSHYSSETQMFVKLLEKQFEKIDIISSGSSLKICRIAEGSATIYPRFGTTMEWDTAAAHAVITAAGFTAMDIQGAELHYNKPDLKNPYFIVFNQKKVSKDQCLAIIDNQNSSKINL